MSTYSTSKQQSSAVSGGVISQPDLDTITRELMCVSGTDNYISLDSGIRYLTCYVFVGEADDHPVFRSVVFAFVLDTQAFPGIVVSLALSPPLELGLVSLEVSFVLDDFDKRTLHLK